MRKKTETVANYQDPTAIEAEFDEKLKRGEITLEQYKEAIKRSATMVREKTVNYESKRLRIKHVANHYYLPIILSDESDRIRYITHIIQIPSEIEFLKKLEEYIEKKDNKFKKFNWWLFSKLDETLDDVYIPYYNPKANTISHFKPDFIFWLQRGKKYFVIFIDPKGTSHTDYQHKIDGYRDIFEDGGVSPKVLPHEGLKAQVFTFLHTADVNQLPKACKKYWFDNIESGLHP